MTAIILAGGKANRMKGQDKAFLKIGQEALIARQLRLLKKLFEKIIIVTCAPRKYRNLKGIQIISDVIPNLGPLGGIYSGLLASNSFYNFVLACDMPFLNEALIRYILRHKDSNDILIPKIDKKFHPLFGIYSKNCIPIIEEALGQGRLNVSSIFPKVKSNFILKQEVKRLDENLLSLVNINTRSDLLIARRIEREEDRLC